MKNTLFILTILTFCLVFTGSFAPAAEKDIESATYKVKEVVDGDTIVVMIDGKATTVDYIGIEAPERGSEKPVVSNEACGKEAAEFNEKLIEESHGLVVLNFDEKKQGDGKNLFAYAHALKYDKDVMTGQTFLNEAIVRAGLAKAVSGPPNIQYDEALKNAEKEAKKEKLGLWSDDICETVEEGTNQECQVIGDVKTKTYHSPTCPALKKIEEKNKKCFKTLKKAIEAGYQACSKCVG